MAQRITQTGIAKDLRSHGWRPDHHNQAFECRSTDLHEGAVTIREERHTYTRESTFTVTTYTGDPEAYWRSESFGTLKLAVQNANERAPAAVEAYEEGQQ